MKIKNINEIFGNILIGFGVLRILIIFIALLSAISIISGNNSAPIINQDTSAIIAILELVLIICSIVMLIKNSRRQTGVTKGYTYALLAFLMELLTSISIIGIFIGIMEGMQLIRAGSKIKSDNSNFYPQNKKIENIINENNNLSFTENDSKNHTDKEISKLIKKKEKIDNEIMGWKKLTKTGEITEEIYIQATSELMEKSKKMEEQINMHYNK